MSNDQDEPRDDYEHRVIASVREWYEDPLVLHDAMHKRFNALNAVCVILSSGTKGYRVPNVALEVDIRDQFVPVWDEIVVLTMVNQLSVGQKFPVTVLNDIVSAFSDWLSCPDKSNWQKRSVETSLQHFEAQLLLFAAWLEIRKDHFPHREQSEGRTPLEAAFLNLHLFPSEHHNAVYGPEDEELAAELKEQEEIFARMPLSVVKKNIERSKASFQFLKNLNLPPGWPKTETWIDDPAAFLTDFQLFVRMFESLVNFDHEIGSFFAKDPPGRLAWIIAIDFVPRLKAALAVCPLPISMERLQRVLEIVATQDADDKIETEVFDEAGNKESTRHSWRPRYTFTQRQALCSEAEQILAGEQAAVAEYVRLKSAQAAQHRPKGPATSVAQSNNHEARSEASGKTTVIAEQRTNDKQATWQSVFGMELSDAADDANDVAYYAEYPAVLADELANDFRRFEQSSASTIHDEWIYWTVSPLTQGPEFYRLLGSLLPLCPVNFVVFSSLRTAIENKIEAGFQTALDAARAELRLLGLWLESTGLWAKRPSESVSSEETNKVHKGIVPPPDLVTFNAIAERLKKAGCPVGAKRLSNLYQEPKIRAEWGEIDDKKGNAYLFEWQRLRPILASQFAAQLKRPLE